MIIFNEDEFRYRRIEDLHGVAELYAEAKARNLHPVVSFSTHEGNEARYVDITTGGIVDESVARRMLEGQLKAHDTILEIKQKIGFMAK